MRWLWPVMRSSIGSKQVVAVTGAGLSLFVLVHMAGNLQVFLGPDAINEYAFKLQSMPALVWATRILLLIAVIIHMGVALRLTLANRRARPIKYAVDSSVQLTTASRNMALTGIVLLSFITYHIAHFTLHIVNNTGYRVDSLGRHDVYYMMVSGFQNPFVASTYILCMILLGFHLSHGIASVFQTFGLNHSKYNCTIRKVGLVLAWTIAIGNISMPVAVYIGLLQLPVVGG